MSAPSTLDLLPSDAPAAPDASDREWLLAALAELIERRGHDRFLAPPIEPGPAAFPEPYRPTRAGVTVVARRCAAHAGLAGMAIEVVDARLAPVVEAKEATELEVEAVGPDHARLVLHLLGTDDVAGTTCHAIGTVIAATARIGADGPFRSTGHAGADDDTRRRGAVAAVWAGLGALAANAAYQQYSHGTPMLVGVHGYAPVDYRVIQAGAVPMSALAFLLAVQAEVRGRELPGGLSGPQRDEARVWRRALAGRGPALRVRLGIPATARDTTTRPPLDAVADEPEDEHLDGNDAGRPRGLPVFRVGGHAGAVGAMLGMVASGLSIGLATANPIAALIGFTIGGAGGYLAGRYRRHDRCADCDVAVPAGAVSCVRCAGVLGRRIRRRSDRLAEAEKDASASGTALRA